MEILDNVYHDYEKPTEHRTTLEVEAFLSKFLPRLEQRPGVVAVYHYVRPKDSSDSTIIVWESQEALNAYRASALMQEAIAFEQAHSTPTTREGYPLKYASRVTA